MTQDITKNTLIHRRIEGIAINVYDGVGFSSDHDREQAIKFWTAGYKSAFYLAEKDFREYLERENQHEEAIKDELDRFTEKMLLIP